MNWLNTSQGFQPAYKFALQPGDVGYAVNANIQLWQSGDLGFDSSNPFRNSLAHYFLPSVDEWYKAAYYDPNANGGLGGYWNYPTGSDKDPTAVSGGTAAGTAVYNQLDSQGPADITKAGGLSPYGVMGMGGNAREWEETEIDLVNNNHLYLRGVRGGYWYFAPWDLRVEFRHSFAPGIENGLIGFRVASIPEPSSLLLGALGMSGLLWWRRGTR